MAVLSASTMATSSTAGPPAARLASIDAQCEDPIDGSLVVAELVACRDLLRELVLMPGVVGIKEGSWEVATYEANRRLIKAVAPQVAVMASGDEHLLTCFVLGSEGSLVSLAVIIPETIVALDTAVRRGDLAAARAAHEVIYPLAETIYGAAHGGFPTARLKTCLKLMGRLDYDAMRPPVPPLSDEEVGRLRTAMARAGLEAVA